MIFFRLLCLHLVITYAHAETFEQKLDNFNKIVNGPLVVVPTLAELKVQTQTQTQTQTTQPICIPK